MKWNPVKKDRRSDLQKAIDRLYELMEVTDPLSDDYETLQTLYCNLMDQKLKEKARIPSADTIFSSATSLLLIEAILHHEQVHVITSKAFSLLPRLFRRT